MSISKVAAAAVAAVALAGCIRNDVPYPRIPQNILSISAEGETEPAKIDDRALTVELTLGESVDIEAVRFSEFTFTEGAECSKNLLEESWNLSKPLPVVLSLYQDYEWTITATQTIERYFAIAGQIGTSVVDAVGRRVIVTMPDTYDLAHLQLTAIKLGPEGHTTITPDLQPGEIDLSKPIEIDVTAWGRTEDWTIYAQTSTAVVTTTEVNAWSRVIWAYGVCEEGRQQGFQYRKAADTEWTDVPEADIVSDGGSFHCCIKGLEPLTEYVVRATSGEDEGEEVKVTTETTEVLPDGDFDQWWLNGKVWCPWNEGGVQFWDTGNTGAATLGQSNVQPSDHVPAGQSGQSAMLATKFVGLFGIGKLAAGSIYSGRFAKVDGTNGILDFGRPWSLRPTKLRGYYQYTPVPIDYASEEYKNLMGRPDSCHIFIALTDWTAPFEIRTNPKNRQLFDKNSPSVIGYGELISGDATDGYVPFEIVVNYRSTSKKPSYILITSAASKYGDFFTGGNGSVLYVDQYSLDYDL